MTQMKSVAECTVHNKESVLEDMLNESRKHCE